MKRLALMLAMLAMSGVASAALIVHADPAPVEYLGAQYIQFTVWVEGTDGDMLSGFDGRFDGPMNQVWVSGIVATPTLDLMAALAPEAQAADSHLLLLSAQYVAGDTPAEDGPGIGSYLAGSGAGANTMAFALLPEHTAANKNLAQIVVPEGDVVNLTAQITSTRNPSDKIAVDMDLVPEPASMAMLGIGGLLVLIRRRRA